MFDSDLVINVGYLWALQVRSAAYVPTVSSTLGPASARPV